MLESISMRTYSHEIILYFSIDIGSNYLRNILERLEQILRTYLVNFLLRIHKWMWALSKPFTGLNMFKFDQIETKCTVESVWPSRLGFHTDTKNCELRHHAAFLRRELDCTWIMCTYVVHIIWDKPGVGVEFFSLFFVQWSFCLATYLHFDVSALSKH